MKHAGKYVRRTTTGYEQVLDYYQTGDCSSCPLKEKCHSSEGNRRIQVSHVS